MSFLLYPGGNTPPPRKEKFKPINFCGLHDSPPAGILSKQVSSGVSPPTGDAERVRLHLRIVTQGDSEMIATFSGWWTEMDTIAQVFYACAAFFSVIFIWQFVASLIGMSGGEMDVDGAVDADFDIGAADAVDAADAADIADAAHAGDAVESLEAFRLFSIRAILAFCTLFFWAGAMYLDQGLYKPVALAYAFGWGLAGWLVVTLLINWMRKLAETGNPQIASCVGKRGAVYMDIPPDGVGKIRITVTGAISMVDARSAGSVAIAAGTPVEVLSKLDDTTVQVRAVDSTTPADSTTNRKEDEK